MEVSCAQANKFTILEPPVPGRVMTIESSAEGFDVLPSPTPSSPSDPYETTQSMPDLPPCHRTRSATSAPTQTIREEAAPPIPRRVTAPAVFLYPSTTPQQQSAISISVDQFNYRVAYLYKDQIVLFSLQFRGSELPKSWIGAEQLPTFHGENAAAITWKGLSLSGSYVAVWGCCGRDGNSQLTV